MLRAGKERPGPHWTSVGWWLRPSTRQLEPLRPSTWVLLSLGSDMAVCLPRQHFLSRSLCGLIHLSGSLPPDPSILLGHFCTRRLVTQKLAVSQKPGATGGREPQSGPALSTIHQPANLGNGGCAEGKPPTPGCRLSFGLCHCLSLSSAYHCSTALMSTRHLPCT